MKITAAVTDSQLQEIAGLASKIWHEHFVSILSMEQIDYMVDLFQSYPALKEQVKNGYEYFQFTVDGNLAGYTGIHEENKKLFLSKLYLDKEYRGKHLGTEAFDFLKDLCRKRGLSHIWLTCNKHNDRTLAVYRHFGFVTVDSQVADIGNGFVMDDYIMEYEIR